VTGEGLGPEVVLVPVKAFAQAKLRLAPALPPAGREALARQMGQRVLEAAAPLPTAVVCDDAAVAAWAAALGAMVLWMPSQGLNGAVDAGVRRLAELSVERATIAHADLPMATSLAWVGTFHGVTLVPDRRRDGTNVMSVPVSAGFRFSYGPHSFDRHLAEATRLGLPVRVVDEPSLAFDIDEPADLAALRSA
jgi:2-phospho-L-lactate/phosphoenolpyruvate guanylyltransferase